LIRYERYSKGNSIDDISEDALAIVQDKVRREGGKGKGCVGQQR